MPHPSKPSLKFLDSAIESIREQLGSFKVELAELKHEIREVRSEFLQCQSKVSESIEGQEKLVTNMDTLDSSVSAITASHSLLTEHQKKLAATVEEQHQYSRKYTLLLSGKVVPPPVRDENSRHVAICLFRDFLGVEVRPGEITACHRLQNKRVILVQFAYLEQRMYVYSRRVKPKQYGLIIHESLTPERLAVVKMLQKLHTPRETSPLLSYYTNSGRIFIKLASTVKPIELAVGTSREDVLRICGGQGSQSIVGRRSGADMGSRVHRGGMRGDDVPGGVSFLPPPGGRGGVEDAGGGLGASAPGVTLGSGSSVDVRSSGAPGDILPGVGPGTGGCSGEGAPSGDGDLADRDGARADGDAGAVLAAGTSALGLPPSVVGVDPLPDAALGPDHSGEGAASSAGTGGPDVVPGLVPLLLPPGARGDISPGSLSACRSRPAVVTPLSGVQAPLSPMSTTGTTDFV